MHGPNVFVKLHTKAMLKDVTVVIENTAKLWRFHSLEQSNPSDYA